MPNYCCLLLGLIQFISIYLISFDYMIVHFIGFDVYGTEQAWEGDTAKILAGKGKEG